MFDITANVTACLQYNHQYNSAENRSNSLDNLSLVFVIMRSGRTSLEDIDLESHNNDYI